MVSTCAFGSSPLPPHACGVLLAADCGSQGTATGQDAGGGAILFSSTGAGSMVHRADVGCSDDVSDDVLFAADSPATRPLTQAWTALTFTNNSARANGVGGAGSALSSSSGIHIGGGAVLAAVTGDSSVPTYNGAYSVTMDTSYFEGNAAIGNGDGARSIGERV